MADDQARRRAAIAAKARAVSVESAPAVPHRGLITATIICACIMQGVDTTIANVALPHMQGSLSASQDQISWVDQMSVRGRDDPSQGMQVTRVVPEWPVSSLLHRIPRRSWVT